MSISRYSAERIHRLDQRERPKPGNKAIFLDEKQLFGHNISFVMFDSQEFSGLPVPGWCCGRTPQEFF